MKKIITLATIALAGLGLTSCDDFLNDNRAPLTVIPYGPEFWNNSMNVDNECNYLYENYTGYGNAGGTGWFYFQTLSDDQAGRSFTTWHTTNVPASNTNYNNGFIEIRRCNFIINNVKTSTLTDDQKLNYEGIARLNRARQYYLLVRMFGDVKWLDEPIDLDTEEGQAQLYSDRTDRKVVMDNVLEDLDFAVNNIAAKSGKTVWSRDLAQAIKSEICLWEGTFWKYCNEADNGVAADPARAKKFLEEAAKASEALIGSYPISDSYNALYNSDRATLNSNSEIIFMKPYERDVFMHSTIDYTCSSTMVLGITRDAFEAFLFTDGKPLALTSEDTNDAGEMRNKYGNPLDMTGVDLKDDKAVAKALEGSYLYIGDILKVRDKRLSVLTDSVVYYPGATWARWGAMQMTSSTGYGVRKYDNEAFPVANRDQTGSNYSCAPLYWISYIYCNLAEAKAELGTLTDADLNATLNKLYARAGLPAQTVAGLSAMADPANNMGVDNLIWEVRRCRRCELMTDNWLRYWDLVRWHQLDKLDNTKYPKIAQGANVKNGFVKPSLMDGDYYSTYFGRNRIYDAKYYLYPIPSGQLSLNENMHQNYLW